MYWRCRFKLLTLLVLKSSTILSDLGWSDPWLFLWNIYSPLCANILVRYSKRPNVSNGVHFSTLLWICHPGILFWVLSLNIEGNNSWVISTTWPSAYFWILWLLVDYLWMQLLYGLKLRNIFNSTLSNRIMALNMVYLNQKTKKKGLAPDDLTVWQEHTFRLAAGTRSGIKWTSQYPARTKLSV